MPGVDGHGGARSTVNRPRHGRPRGDVDGHVPARSDGKELRSSEHLHVAWCRRPLVPVGLLMTDSVGGPGKETDESPLRRKRRLLRRLSWTTADQVVSSATNALLSLFVAREVTAAEFGSFALAFVAFTYATGIARALVGDPLMVRFSGAASREQTGAIAQATGAAIVVGVGLGLVSVAIGLLLAGLTGTLLVILGLLLPGLLLQDQWRISFFASARPQAAFVNDSIWGVLQLGAIVALMRTGSVSPENCLTAWGIAALMAGGVGVLQARVRPQLRGGLRWIRDNRDIGLRFTSGFVVNQGAFALAFAAVGAVAGVAAVGALRGAQVLIRPVGVVFSSLAAFTLPMLSARTARREPISREALLQSVAATALAGVWTLLLLAIPTSLGEALLGDTWAGAQEVLALVGLQVAAVGFALGAAIGLKALSAAGLLLRVEVIQGVLALGLGAAGAAWNAAVGAALGMLIAQAVGATLCWWYLRLAHRTAQAQPSVRSPLPHQ